MPSTTMPRPGHVMNARVDVAPFSLPTGFLSRSHSGVVKTRTAVESGRVWSEEFGPLNMLRPDTQEFMSWIRWAWSRRQVFFVRHPSPGLEYAHLGVTSAAGLTVSGASQAGSSINIAGWELSTSNLLLPGTFIKISGINRIFEVTDPVNSNVSGVAAVGINSPIYVGASPANNADVSINNNLIRATFLEEPSVPGVEGSFWWSGLKLSFVEVI